MPENITYHIAHILINVCLTTIIIYLLIRYSSLSKKLKGYPGAPGPQGEKGDVGNSNINIEELINFYNKTNSTLEVNSKSIDTLISLLNYAYIDKLKFKFNQDVYALNQINEFKENITDEVVPIMKTLFNSLNLVYTEGHTLQYINSMIKVIISRRVALLSDIKQLLEDSEIPETGNIIFSLDELIAKFTNIKI